MSDVTRYLDMERAFYADLVKQSNYASEAFTRLDTAEQVVGFYAQHEAFDYERWLLGGITIHPDAIALEYGCGPGRMLRRVAPLFARVDGADISRDLLEIARRRCADLPSVPTLLLTNGQELPSELDGAYDIAFSVICLQHICVYAIRRRILESLYRVLKPGGILTFQLGYGPGHPAMVDYFEDFVDAPATNSAADVGVLHPAEIAGDLASIGFVDTAYALTPTGPGDTHGAWIFVRAVKPGRHASVDANVQTWAGLGFATLLPDDVALERARERHLQHGVIARRRQLEGEVAVLQEQVQSLQARVEGQTHTIAHLLAERNQFEDRWAIAVGDADAWRDRAAALRHERDRLQSQADASDRQLRRLRVADRRRLRSLMADLVSSLSPDDMRLGIFGAGEHTAWLLRDTDLGKLTSLVVFDSDPARAGSTVGGFPVHHVSEIGSFNLQAVVVSSLAFQDEITATLESLGLDDVRIVRCYP